MSNFNKKLLCCYFANPWLRKSFYCLIKFIGDSLVLLAVLGYALKFSSATKQLKNYFISSPEFFSYGATAPSGPRPPLFSKFRDHTL
jgi:hypothetical protein